MQRSKSASPSTTKVAYTPTWRRSARARLPRPAHASCRPPTIRPRSL